MKALRAGLVLLALNLGTAGLSPSYFVGDVDAFSEWAETSRLMPKKLYLWSGCNYPVYGALATAGFMIGLEKAMPGAERSTYHRIFLAFLLAVQCAAMWLFYLTLRTAGEPHALLWASLLTVSPATWAGGASWGQIDVLSQMFLLAFLLCAFRLARGLDQDGPDATGRIRLFVVAVAAATVMLLTKQLAWLNGPGAAGIVVLLAFYLHRADRRAARTAVLWGLLCGVLLLFVPDRCFTLPPNTITHLQTILARPNSAADFIGGNGFNVWTLMNVDMFTFRSDTVVWAGLSPRQMGSFLLKAYLGCLPAMAAWAFRQCRGKSITAKLVDLCWLSALLNLAANVLLTGTHERYLYHFFPQALIALLYWNRRRSPLVTALLAVLLLLSVYYGGYVYVIVNKLWGEPGVYTWLRYQNLVGVFAALLAVFTVLTPYLLRSRAPGLRPASDLGGTLPGT